VTATVSDGGTLVGTLTATASSGVATFSTLGIRGFGGTAYTITYTALDLTTATQSVTPSALSVGNTGPGGGNIYYVAASAGFTCGPTLNETCYYLEAAPSGAVTRAHDWSFIPCDDVECSVPIATGTVIGTGYKNTLAMVSLGVGDYAGDKARAYTGNTLTDWFLPSKDELNQMCKWIRNISGVNCNNDDGSETSTLWWWSSTRSIEALFSAWGQSFDSGMPMELDIQPNGGTIFVWPVRSF
jgi:hypothetical protein